MDIFFQPNWLHIKSYIAKTRALPLKWNWILEGGGGARSPLSQKYDCWNLGPSENSLLSTPKFLIITRPCLGVFEFNFNFIITSYNNPSDGRLQIALFLPLLVLALLKKSRQMILRRSTSWGDLCFELNIFLWDPALKKDPIYTCTCTWVEKCLPFKYMKLFHVQKSNGLHVNILFHTKWATVSFYLFPVTYILTQKHLHIFELHNIII